MLYKVRESCCLRLPNYSMHTRTARLLSFRARGIRLFVEVAWTWRGLGVDAAWAPRGRGVDKEDMHVFS